MFEEVDMELDIINFTNSVKNSGDIILSVVYCKH